MNTQRYLISVDWFQVTCEQVEHLCLEEGIVLLGTMVPEHDKQAIYELARAREFNAIYEHSLAVLFHGFQLATIFFNPRPHNLPRSMCSVKVANRLLYSGNWAFYLVDICRALKWKIKNIGRVDVCADFTTFAGGLSPYNFINGFLREGKASQMLPSYVRVGSNKYTCMGKKEVVSEDVSGSLVLRTRNVVDYLRFGSRSTGVSVYLYCKSRELAEVHDKPYITDAWVKSGILPTPTDEDLRDPNYSPPDVFRLELSINSGGLNIKRKKTPEDKNEVRTAINMIAKHVKPLEVDRLAVSDFLCQSSIENLFWAYANKYFRFKIVGTQKYKQYWNDLRLFDVQLKPTIKPYSISRNLGSGIAERNAAITLNKILMSVKTLSMSEMVAVDKAIEVLERQSHLKSTSINQHDLLLLIQHLKLGYSMEEIQRKAIIATRHMEQMKQLIYESVYHEIREILTDSDVAAAVQEYEIKCELAREQAALQADYYNLISAIS